MDTTEASSLDSFLKHFSLKAGVFYAGPLCGTHEFPCGDDHGHLHLIQSGSATLCSEGEDTLSFAVDKPTLLFLPQPRKHRLITDENTGINVICGTVQFGPVSRNPVTQSLPAVVRVELQTMPAADLCLRMMQAEAFAGLRGRRAILDRLCEVLAIHLLRHCMEHELATAGALAGLADRRLSKALQVIHEDPAAPLQVDTLASVAGMSRARFAAHFKRVIGETPADYIATLRLNLCQKLLRHAVPLKQIAAEIGYGSTSAMTRAFIRKFGCTPSVWQKRD